MDKSTFNFLQKVAYDYSDTKRRIAEIENEILYGTHSSDDDVQAGRTSVRNNTDITSLKAISLVEDTRLVTLRKQIDAIDHVFETLICEKKDFIQMLYWSVPRKSIQMIAYDEKNGISERTAYRWRREFLTEVGKKLGLVE